MKYIIKYRPVPSLKWTTMKTFDSDNPIDARAQFAKIIAKLGAHHGDILAAKNGTLTVWFNGDTYKDPKSYELSDEAGQTA